MRYSVTVSALTAVEAHIVFEEEFEETKRLQERLPLVLADMEALKVPVMGSTTTLFYQKNEPQAPRYYPKNKMILVSEPAMLFCDSPLCKSVAIFTRFTRKYRTT